MAIRSFDTFQEAFDATMEALAKQGYLSIDYGDCFYRHHKNHNIKCAVGMWLTDEEAEKYEGCSAINLSEGVLPLIHVKNASEVDIRHFWGFVQNVHDLPGCAYCLRLLQDDFGVNTEKFNLIKDLPEYGN